MRTNANLSPLVCIAPLSNAGRLTRKLLRIAPDRWIER
jgi:hypothetical protein